MIRAVFDTDGQSIKLSIRGHAEHGECGEDIVCAAVSGIFYSLIGYLANCAEDATIGPIEHGYADVVCPVACAEAMKQTCIGLMQIQASYPLNITVKNDVWDFRTAAKNRVVVRV